MPLSVFNFLSFFSLICACHPFFIPPCLLVISVPCPCSFSSLLPSFSLFLSNYPLLPYPLAISLLPSSLPRLLSTSILYLFPPYFSLLHLSPPPFKPPTPVFPLPSFHTAGGDGHSSEGVLSAQSPGQLHQPDAGCKGTRGGREHRREEESQQGIPQSHLFKLTMRLLNP